MYTFLVGAQTNRLYKKIDDEEKENDHNDNDEKEEEPSYDKETFVQFLDILSQEFDSRFSDFKKFDLAFKFLNQNIFQNIRSFQHKKIVLRIRYCIDQF